MTGDRPVTLQQRAANWHSRRFPEAKPYNVALKSGEELGELQKAVNSDLIYFVGDVPHGAPEEAADIMVSLLVLLGRWYSDSDLLSIVEKKLDLFETVNGGHRACLREGD